MKYPKIPTRPYAPYKPVEPPKQIEKRTSLGTLLSQEDHEFTLESLAEHIRTNLPSADPTKVKFSLEIAKDYGYYDEVYTHLNINCYNVEMVDDPDYDRKFSFYEKALEKYKHDYAVYTEAMKKYKIAEKQYKKDLELWQVEHARAIIEKHEKNKRPGKKAIGSKK